MLVTVDPAEGSTLTVTVMIGQLFPEPSESLRVQEIPLQVQPLPAIDTRVRPAGTASVTVTAPEVEFTLAALLTVRVYVALFWP